MVILYSTHCPKCNVLQKKLDIKGIKYEIVDDEQLMIDKGFLNAPMLEINEDVMDFISAIKWVDSQE